MKRVLAFISALRARIGRGNEAFHNDALRANQPNEPVYTFSYWRSLVG
jgi:hypothetical protein